MTTDIGGIQDPHTLLCKYCATDTSLSVRSCKTKQRNGKHYSDHMIRL
jgi:hypothetical protein